MISDASAELISPQIRRPWRDPARLEKPPRLATDILAAMQSYTYYRLRNTSGSEPYLRTEHLNLVRFNPALVHEAAEIVLEQHLDRETFNPGYSYAFLYLAKLLSKAPRSHILFSGALGAYQPLCAHFSPAANKTPRYDPSFSLINHFLRKCALLDRNDMAPFFASNQVNKRQLSFGPAADIFSLGISLASQYLDRNRGESRSLVESQRIICRRGLVLVGNHINWFVNDGVNVKLSPRSVEFICNHAQGDWIDKHRSDFIRATPSAYIAREGVEANLWGLNDRGLRRWWQIYHNVDISDQPSAAGQSIPQLHSRSDLGPRSPS